MAHRTQIICLHEGEQGKSIDPVFASSFIRYFDPTWLRPFKFSKIRTIALGGRSQVMRAVPQELKKCESAGADVSLVVMADIDEDPSPEVLKSKFWQEAQKMGISKELFEKATFIFPRKCLENWVEFLIDGKTDEARTGKPIDDNTKVRTAAKKLAGICKEQKPIALPQSLEWSCANWHALTKRMQQ